MLVPCLCVFLLLLFFFFFFFLFSFLFFFFPVASSHLNGRVVCRPASIIRLSECRSQNSPTDLLSCYYKTKQFCTRGSSFWPRRFRTKCEMFRPRRNKGLSSLCRLYWHILYRTHYYYSVGMYGGGGGSTTLHGGLEQAPSLCSQSSAHPPAPPPPKKKNAGAAVVIHCSQFGI